MHISHLHDSVQMGKFDVICVFFQRLQSISQDWRLFVTSMFFPMLSNFSLNYCELMSKIVFFHAVCRAGSEHLFGSP